MNQFISTRNKDSKKVDFKGAILSPVADNNGLYTIKDLPKIDFKTFLDSSYSDLCKAVFKELKLDIPNEVLDSALNLYKEFDDKNNPAPINNIDSVYFLELYHGATRAFKDMALTPFGEIFSYFANLESKKFLILSATSGDTGPATLNAFANKENIKVITLYPKGGTSDVQELQMITNDAKNLAVFGIKGNFDDAQKILKDLLADNEFNSILESKGYSLSAANSVNFGRIAFQIIYHIWGYLSLVKKGAITYGDKLKIIIPSGNFGNALGAFFAKIMGLPLDKIIIASNKNNILSELINTGIYDISNKTLQKTLSPAMDILKSSNVERILFALFGDKRTNELMNELESKKKYTLNESELKTLQEHFKAAFLDDEQTEFYINEAFKKGYLIDPHTAVGYGVYKNMKLDEVVLIASTAEWSKFAPIVAKSVFNEKLSDFEAIKKLESNGAKLDSKIKDLLNKKIVHNEVLELNKVKERIISWL